MAFAFKTLHEHLHETLGEEAKPLSSEAKPLSSEEAKGVGSEAKPLSSEGSLAKSEEAKPLSSETKGVGSEAKGLSSIGGPPELSPELSPAQPRLPKAKGVSSEAKPLSSTFFAEAGARGGRFRMASLSPEERKKLAMIAATKSAEVRRQRKLASQQQEPVQIVEQTAQQAEIPKKMGKIGFSLEVPTQPRT